VKAQKRVYAWVTSQTYFNSRVDFGTEHFISKTNRSGSGENQN